MENENDWTTLERLGFASWPRLVFRPDRRRGRPREARVQV